MHERTEDDELKFNELLMHTLEWGEGQMMTTNLSLGGICVAPKPHSYLGQHPLAMVVQDLFPLSRL
jgi:hypothetical protein